MNTEEFIAKAKLIHGNKYDYSKTDLNNRDEKGRICIICHELDLFGMEHGEFWQTPNNHLHNHGCPKCNGKGFSDKYYISIAKIRHNNKYDYSKTKFSKITEKCTIICPIHGEFEQEFRAHLSGQGCRKCAGTNKMTTEEFISKAKEVHGNKYDYSKVNYTGNNKTEVCIICREHGEFWQKPNVHLLGYGCDKCSKKHKHTTEEFIKLAKKVHGNKYDYHKVEYTNNSTKVCIICPEHGEFWMKPNSHLNGQGCPICKYSRLEDNLYDYLFSKYEIIRRYRTNWLGRQELDFYIPSKKIAIECQGIQHFEPINFWGGSKKLEYIKKLDEDKKNKCLKEGIELIYYTRYNIDGLNYIGKIFNNIDEIEKYIDDTSNKT